uniref:Putative serine protease inhibitor n=1 Tax=Rhipicephalus microplus TaxID=6941 RepID=A0A6G5A2M5_RHIMP
MCSTKMKCTCCYMVLWSVIVTCVRLLLDEGHSWHNSSRERHYLIPPPPDEYPPLKEEDPDKRPDKCLLQYDSGVREASKPSTVWFYSTTYGACMPFTYNGCNGNETGFHLAKSVGKNANLMSGLKNTTEKDGTIDISSRPQKYTFMLRTQDSDFKEVCVFCACDEPVCLYVANLCAKTTPLRETESLL